jgi:hypothetical protein
MKHSRCSDCTHSMYMYESQYRPRDSIWTSWSGTILGKESTIKIMLDQSSSLKYVTRTFTNGAEHRYRKIKE